MALKTEVFSGRIVPVRVVLQLQTLMLMRSLQLRDPDHRIPGDQAFIIFSEYGRVMLVTFNVQSMRQYLYYEYT